ncbi:MAG: arginine repressor [Angelakisella sp.]
MKSARQEKLLQLIEKHTIATQEELQALLRQEGIAATQATISRDIRELRLVKKLSSTGGYYYSIAQEPVPAAISLNVSAVFLESIKSVDHAGNFVVVKCFAGMANAVCATIDNGRWDGLVGTLAGDDTIFLLLRTEEQAKEFAQYVTDMVKKR